MPARWTRLGQVYPVDILRQAGISPFARGRRATEVDDTAHHRVAIPSTETDRHIPLSPIERLS
jgi:hypothetical protein